MPRARASGPVLKWAGGKTQLLEDILSRLPRRMKTYFEPFVGGGAVFFALAEQCRFERAVLADRNQDLVDVYQALKEDVEGVIAVLQRYRYDEATYYEVRSQRPRKLVRRAARLIYLNRTGYNGLYRVNRTGQFNVPFGRYKNPTICHEPTLRAAARALQRATIQADDFEPICRRARPGDAVYLDPPYLPLSKTSSFTAYDRHPFGVPEHERLARVFGDLAGRGVNAVLSNSLTPMTSELYRQWKTDRVRVTRPINCRPESRGPVDEILVVTRPALPG